MATNRFSRWLSALFGGRGESDEVPRTRALKSVTSQQVGPRTGAPSAEVRSQSREQRPSRLVHLGVDFGTCWSKLVLRDYEAPTPRCFVVRPGNRHDAGTNYRVPSSVTLLDGRLYFGWTGARLADRPGARIIRSPKVRAAFPGGQDPELPAEVSAEDIATLVVAYLLGIGFSSAQSYCETLKPRATPRMSMSMGVPMSILDRGALRDQFLRIARTAYDIWKTSGTALAFHEGVDPRQAMELLSASRERLRSRPVADPRGWIRSEAEAGLLWIFRSPAVGEGLYACIDVGAGTTDVSVFRIRTRRESGTWIKDALGFYSAVSAPPGVDALDERLASLDGHGLTLESLRMRENEVIRTHRYTGHPKVRSFFDQVFGAYLDAWRSGYQKEPRESAWHRYGLFVLGGGSKIEPLISRLEETVWSGRLACRKALDAGFPEDLYEWPSGTQLSLFKEDAAFLLVAYGLSYLATDVPEVDNPADMPPFVIPRHPRPPIDQDEYYPK
jgi:hypothetical protein